MKKSELKKMIRETIIQEGSNNSEALKDLVQIGKILSDKLTLQDAARALEQNPKWAIQVSKVAEELLNKLSLIA